MDVVDKATRSRMMSGIKSRDTKPELDVRRLLHKAGFRFRLHDRKLPSRPDIVLPRHRAVVLIHGCFWHQHPGCKFAYVPKTRPDFWIPKLRGNVARDKKNAAELVKLGWRVFTVWECQITETNIQKLMKLIPVKGIEATSREH